jgi:hypothetical protein
VKAKQNQGAGIQNVTSFGRMADNYKSESYSSLSWKPISYLAPAVQTILLNQQQIWGI